MILGLSIAGTVLISIAVFVLVMILLVFVLLYARKKLTPQGDVTLKINDREMVVSPAPVFSPQCQITASSFLLLRRRRYMRYVQMPDHEGGGSILPTETGSFTRREQHDNWRLGCQVKVREDMTIKVPEAVLGVKKWECEVVSNRNVATFIKEFVVRLPEGEDLHFRSGDYIQIDVPKYDVEFGRDIEVDEEYRSDWDKFKMWDLKFKNTEETYRAYSMANFPAEKNLIILNIRIATPPWDNARKQFMNVPPGICSTYIFSRKPGDKVSISGPYGEFHIKNTENEMVYVGGGAGMAPLRSHIFHLLKTQKSDRKISYWYGARSKREVFYEDEFRELEKKFPNFTFNIALSEPLRRITGPDIRGSFTRCSLTTTLASRCCPKR
jgi:Na+-transporting NADH:ubiquinone oxidoreductase subunit F